MLSQKLIDKIEQRQISLKEFELNDRAYSKDDAIDLIKSIMNDEIGIWGGDVLQLVDNRLNPLSDNWYSEPKINESKEEFFFRSKSESLKYIESYSSNVEGIIFTLVFTERF